MVALSLYVLFLVLPNQIVCAGRSTVNLRSISSVTVLYRLTVVDLDRVVDKGKRRSEVDGGSTASNLLIPIPVER
jgi:hypothetical protein